nr:hypothetical protein [Tanacetum cinerariifolium]
MAFVSSSNNNTSNTNGAVNTTQAVKTVYGVSTASTQVNVAYSTNIYNLSDVVICSFFASQPNSPQLEHEDLEQIHPDDMKEMDLRWQEGPNYVLMAISSSSFDLDAMKIIMQFHLHTHENLMPPTPDLSFTGLDKFVNKPVVKNCKAKSSKEEPKVVRKNDDAPIIREEDVSQPTIKKKIVRPSIAKIEFVKSKQQEKTARKTVKQV